MPNREKGLSLAERLTNQVPQALSSAAATFVDSLKINSILEKARRGHRVVIKRRNVYGEQLADLANLYFRMSGIPIRFWSKTEEWQRDDDFTVRNQQEIAQAATATTAVMTILLGSIAGVSLVVGGIGIMNIMLVSVTERTREIGVRMAVGARGNDILTQFLIEAVTLSSVGGVIGIICGVGASKILSVYASWPTLISISSVAIAFLFSAAVGIFFGFYPAHKAAALDPIEALRYE
jgi:hypothetical protein